MLAHSDISAGIEYLWVFINLALAFMCLLYFLLCSYTCPGYLENKRIDFQDFLENIDSTQLCPDCCAIRTSRSRHCSVCNHCIERFDHHCPWINNCVGVHNHNYFILYIYFQLATVAISLAQGLHAMVVRGEGDKRMNPDYFCSDWQFQKDETLFYIMTIGAVVISGFFIIPLCILVYV